MRKLFKNNVYIWSKHKCLVKVLELTEDNLALVSMVELKSFFNANKHFNYKKNDKFYVFSNSLK